MRLSRLDVGVGHNLYPEQEQLQNLGLDIGSLSGKKVLDIGCGRSARLVRYLKERGIHAEGIDEEVWADQYTMKKDWRKIPREDGSYDVVVSHMALSILGSALTVSVGKITKNEKKHLDRWAEDLFAGGIKEVLRVMKRDGIFVYFPASYGPLRRRAEEIVAAAGYYMEDECVPLSRPEYFVHPLTRRADPRILEAARKEYATRTIIRRKQI